ncbi:protein of unknown function - conserved [Leishmania donovani]|uniref:Uncharacterized protein n=3 Tax=Leishmania donovani species complex TaxID=38574 RepID=A4I869_LEIIN|nr:conserved hypothetical protein [Leishmania infantum JPCM5]XP_003863675.1 hypothetical protein, conserved [Leishmania donovani]CAC9526430.1 hypothetical_protein_-_conserved [Leishmania infantum]AYU81810.1 hypothetical protein LdCL_320031900 [Leishmania donovani]TPP43770.1 hypothetical protein CGC21_20845 [Leishmania donovani]TPP47268.1 hypothetical protein CGC20_34615 [Leishmania donovani]CAJ1991795.1 protein of unknown function - conserved [Leishmania donovani]|eukprot:XP_001467938.1 conserved hypothetical protein [Leishmania infantum JPCM5]
MSSGRNSPDSDSVDEWAAPPQAFSEGDAPSGAAAPAAAAGGGRSMEAMDAVERDLAGASVTVLFQLPNGEMHRAMFFMGQSVENMKALLEKEKDLPYEKTTLYLGDRMLFDPLSLSDLPFDPKIENLVKVEMTT